MPWSTSKLIQIFEIPKLAYYHLWLFVRVLIVNTTLTFIEPVWVATGVTILTIGKGGKYVSKIPPTKFFSNKRITLKSRD